ncbi:MAG: glutaredoxin, partial [Sphingomonas sp.]|nr:glutaredoxin [Sphingomonas sp.]
MATQAVKRAELYRMVMEDHTCPYGLKALDLLKREGYEVNDHHLTT